MSDHLACDALSLPSVFRNADPDLPPLAFHLTQRARDSIILLSQSYVRRKASNCSGYRTVQLIVSPPLSKAVASSTREGGVMDVKRTDGPRELR